MPERGNRRTECTASASAPTGTKSSTRRRFLGGTVGAGALASFGGCLTGLTGSGSGSGGDSGNGATTGGTTSDSSGTTLNVAAVEGSGRLFKRLVEDYVQDDTGVKINVTLVPFSNLHAKINSVLGNQGDAYDLIFLPDIWLPQYANDLEPIKDWVPGDYPDQVVDSCVVDGTWPAPNWPDTPSGKGMDPKLRGQVVVGNTQLFAYNEKHYQKVGEDTPPETWDDVLRAGKKIEEQLDGVNGYVVRGKRGNPIMTNFFPVGTSKAGRMFDDNWKFNWNTQEGIDSLSYYAKDLKSISPNGVASFDSDAVLQRLGNGTAAQASAWPAAASLLLNPDKSEAANDIKFTVCPKGASGRAPQIGTWMAGINKYSDDAQKKAAGKVIGSFISAEAQDKYVKLGGVPFRNDTLKNHADAQPWFGALQNSLQQAVWRPRTPLWNQIGITFGKYLNSAVAGNMAPADTMQKAENDFHELLSRANYYNN